MFKAEVLVAEDLMDEKRTVITGRGHGMAKTAYKAKKEAFRMARADLNRNDPTLCGGVPILETVEITNILTREVTFTC